jgi:hypothetical protein
VPTIENTRAFGPDSAGDIRARIAFVNLRRATATSLLIFVIFNLNLRAISSRDARVIYLTAASFGLWRTTTLDRFPAVRSEEGIAVVDGHLVPLYPIIPAVVAAPAFAFAAAVGVLDRANPSQETMEAIGKIWASALTAVACGILFLLVRRWVPGAPAALVVIAAALSTPYWSTASQALWSHATAACALVTALWACRRMETSRGAALIAGLAVMAAVCTRPLLLPFAVGLLVYGRRSVHRAWLMLGMAGVLACVVIWNLSVVGRALGGLAVLESADVHQQTHMVQSTWTLNLAVGALGILVSPNRGLLVFMPLVCWTVVGGARLWRRSIEARLTIVLPTLLYVIGWSAYRVWWGGHSYGPRYIADLVVPLAVMGAATLFDDPVSVSRWSRTAAAVALAWGITVQAVGAFCYPGGQWNDTPVDVDHQHARLWDWSDLEIVRTATAGPYTKHLPRLSRFVRTPPAYETPRPSDSGGR